MFFLFLSFYFIRQVLNYYPIVFLTTCPSSSFSRLPSPLPPPSHTFVEPLNEFFASLPLPPTPISYSLSFELNSSLLKSFFSPLLFYRPSLPSSFTPISLSISLCLVLSLCLSLCLNLSLSVWISLCLTLSLSLSHSLSLSFSLSHSLLHLPHSLCLLSLSFSHSPPSSSLSP